MSSRILIFSLLCRSENSEEQPPLPTLKPAPSIKPKFKENENQNLSKQMPTVLPSFTIPTQNGQLASNNTVKTGTVPSIPLPLLILNSLQPQQAVQDKIKGLSASSNGNSKERIPAGNLF